ncbi:Tho2p [Sporobolomyces koalae]|uniref:Tho2p n=1 Tax=Sporobolomyces koalae TaxID=500713 RepID=UPI00316F7050
MTMDPESVRQVVDRYLEQPSDASPLSDVLKTLTSSRDPQTSLVLFSTVHHLLISLLQPSTNTPTIPRAQQIYNLLHDSVFASLTDRDEDKAKLADCLLDVVWQLDQEIDSGVFGVTVDNQQDQTEAKTAQEAAVAGRKSLAQLLRALVNGGDIPKEAALERLELSLIAQLDFIQDSLTFGRTEVRQRTALFYKQQKFNLLREESEGYAKLVVELLGNMGPAHDLKTAQSCETVVERKRRAVSVNDKVKSLIGNFDLDPTRTLDIFLDTFSDQILEHYQFFLDFLSVSPWAPKSKRGLAGNTSDSKLDKGKQKALPVEVDIEDEDGSSTIAQILGFKFAFYQAEDAGVVPENLYLTAAMLIWHGYIKLSDLWNHLSPSDADLSKIDAKYREEQAQLARSVGGANALAMAGALVDDEAPVAGKSAASNATATSITASAPNAPPKELPNQKVGLLKALLIVGDMTHSMFILAQWPILVHAFPEVADLLNRLLAISIAPAYDSISISRQHPQWAEEFSAPRSRTILDAKGDKKVLIPDVKRLITGQAFPNPRGVWTFFFPSWTERTPKAGDAEEVLTVLEKTFMPFLGIFISRDFSLFTKICRIISNDLKSDPSRPREARWLDLLRIHLLPSLSLLSNHSVSSLEVWAILSLFPIEKRFELYGEWKDVWYRKIPILGVRKAEAEKDVKSILRRLSTENVKKLGKTLAKVAHTNPTVIWSVALNQVMSYDNLILPVIDAARYLTELGYDVLAYCVLDALSGTRNKTKEDGTSVAMWLSGIASFTGQLYRRWAPMASSLPVILQYLVNQLVSGNSKDLIVLRELISRMTAIEPFADLSDAQVLSLAGGRNLRNEVFQQTDLAQAGKRAQMTQLANARVRLQQSLLGDKERSLAMPLLVNIALQRQACLKNTEAHLKSLGALFDQNHAILFQYTELLSALTEPDQLAQLLPSIPALISTFHLSPSIAFDLARPKLRLAMRHYDEKEAAEQEAKRKKDLLEKLQKEKKAASAATGAAAEGEAADKTKIDTVVVDGEDVKMEDVKVDDVKMEDLEEVASRVLSATEANGESATAEASPSTESPWHPGLIDLVGKMNEILPEEAQLSLGSAFFVTFWQMTLYDLIYPKERYDAEVSRLKGLQREAATNTSIPAGDRDTFIAKIIDLATKLMAEMGRHFSASRGATRRLEKEKGHWFSNVRKRDDRVRLVGDVLQYCVEPRARLSLPDAVYSYQMVKRLHSMNTDGFHTIVFFDQLLTSQVSPTLFSCTENEARNYGRFLYDVLADLANWHKDEKAYKAEAIGDNLRGFARYFSPPDSNTPLEHYSHGEVQKAINKWHASMIRGFQESFRSEGYMHIKNSILVLTKIAPYFPIEYEHGQHIAHSVEELIAVEKREDLKILAQGYQAVIAKRKKHWVNAPSAPPLRATSQSLASTPTGSPAPAATASQAAASRSSIPAKPSTLAPPADTASPVPSGPSRSNPVRPSSNLARTPSSSVPSGPKGLPNKPGSALTSNRSTPIANDAPPASSSRSGPSGNSAASKLPARPGTGAAASNPARPNPTREDSSSATEKLRQQALASRISAAAPNASSSNGTASSSTATKSMDPPPAPSATAATSGRSLPTRPDASSRGGSRASSPKRDDSDRGGRRGDRDPRDREKERDRDGDSAGSRRPSRERERDSHRDRERDKDKDRMRERSVDSSHSSSRRGGDRDDRERRHASDKDRDRSDRLERSSRDKDTSRSSRDDRDRDERTSNTRRTSDRHERDRGSDPASRSGSRRDRDSRDRPPTETSAARRAREADERAKSEKEKEKERQRESDRLREEQRERDRKDKRDRDDGHRDRDRDSRRSSSGRVSDRHDDPPPATSSRNGQPGRAGGPASSAPSKSIPSGPAIERLKPAPAMRSPRESPSNGEPTGSGSARGGPPAPASGPSGLPMRPAGRARQPPTNGTPATSSAPVPTGPAASRVPTAPAAKATPPREPAGGTGGTPPSGPVNMIVKGRGRLYEPLVSEGGGNGGNKRRADDDMGRKRAAPTGPLADRLAPEEKRARTDEGSGFSVRGGGRSGDNYDRRR